MLFTYSTLVVVLFCYVQVEKNKGERRGKRVATLIKLLSLVLSIFISCLNVVLQSCSIGEKGE